MSQPDTTQHAKGTLRLADIMVTAPEGWGRVLALVERDFVDGGPLVAVISEFESVNDFDRANARRLVATWNACDGIPTEALEQLPSIIGASVPYRQLQAQRDALLKDLQEAAATLRRYEVHHREKGTADSLAKAEVNAELAARFERTIVHTHPAAFAAIPA